MATIDTRSGVASPPHRRRARTRWAPAATRLAQAAPALATLLIVKVLVLALGVLTRLIFTNEPLRSWRAVLAAWNGWDGPHYLNLARYGYEATGERAVGIVFYPLFPWLIRLAARLVGDYLVGAFLVATLASFVAVALFDRLVRLDHDDATARRAVWYFCIFPTSYFLHIGYTEGLFLALALGALLAARTDRWPLAGLLGALACLTRVNGLLLLPTLAIEALLHYRQTRRLEPRWAWLGLIPVGFAGYLLLNYRVTGDPFTFMRVTREHWHKGLAPPWDGIRAMVASYPWRPPIDQVTYVGQQTLFLAVATLGLAAALLRLRPTYAAWIALNLLLITSTTFIYSLPRYCLLLFPLPLLFARLGKRPTWHTALTAGSILLLALLVILFITQRGLAY